MTINTVLKVLLGTLALIGASVAHAQKQLKPMFLSTSSSSVSPAPGERVILWGAWYDIDQDLGRINPALWTVQIDGRNFTLAVSAFGGSGRVLAGNITDFGYGAPVYGTSDGRVGIIWESNKATTPESARDFYMTDTVSLTTGHTLLPRTRWRFYFNGTIQRLSDDSKDTVLASGTFQEILSGNLTAREQPTHVTWFRDGKQVSRNSQVIGQTQDFFEIPSYSAFDHAGIYTMRVENHLGSAEAHFTVGSKPDGSSKLVNISTRSFVGTGGDMQIAGFVISGSSPKTVLIRASGPTLTKFGVAGALANPKLEIHDGKRVILSNDDWSSDPVTAANIEAVLPKVGAFEWEQGSKDAAILATLNPGNYTALVSGANNGTGVALIEAYDVHGSPKFVNISTRSLVKTGGEIQIAGFVISGTSPKKVLIRASGPALTKYGVTGALTNPKLELHDGKQVIMSNDDWSSEPLTAVEIEAVRPTVGAFEWETGSKDAAILATLNPGNYTALVSGVNNGTGVALIEVYEVK